MAVYCGNNSEHKHYEEVQFRVLNLSVHVLPTRFKVLSVGNSFCDQGKKELKYSDWIVMCFIANIT